MTSEDIGRFCTICSCGETEEWARLLEQYVFQVNHWHVVFTIDEGLREVFYCIRKNCSKNLWMRLCG
ncbi:transposase zinc-binding domain-containing protein [Paenibacillus sp. FSL H7-0331]|uniref:transposase zinc-binding domain-containing protein n=1 Tax=Paenibacillus sp. FSL H7-0331 TaxID=1920421 RepID=UPI00096C2C97|nr:transposase zinc-binding domain-containing protein [Paenibacillus sp. FSL H7-0331]OMF16320.1 hypothetical protein BK127_12910 [Paenibacillus sp. FSL H7-0331]